MNRSNILIAVIVAAVLVVGGAAWYILGSSSSDTPDLGADAPVAITVTPDDMTLGKRTAPITVVEYAAPMCPHCARMNEEGFPVLKSQYIDTGKVFYIFRVFPIGNADAPAEGIARCLPKDKYFNFMDLLFRKQDTWDPEYGISDVEGGLVALGRIAGLSADQTRTCMADPANDARVKAQSTLAATRYGVTGTPTFIVAGKVLAGGLPWDDVKKAIDGALAAKK
ncbi:MAG: DsbA family protein [Proteobacteria bacterium]|nr:DsbA family protein [Pseudomonadota bacterium]